MNNYHLTFTIVLNKKNDSFCNDDIINLTTEIWVDKMTTLH